MDSLRPTDALLVIDVQNDFCPGGALAVENGDQIIPAINALAQQFEHVILTQDWHPSNHISFAHMHGRKHFESVDVHYGPQTLWPPHCVQNTWGAELHPGLSIPHAEHVVRKGTNPVIDSYSAFLENDHTTSTGLADYLRQRNIRRLFLCGLAYDFCVRFSAIDGARLGFETVVIEDASAPVNLPGSVAATNREFADAGIKRVRASSLLLR